MKFRAWMEANGYDAGEVSSNLGVSRQIVYKLCGTTRDSGLSIIGIDLAARVESLTLGAVKLVDLLPEWFDARLPLDKQAHVRKGRGKEQQEAADEAQR